MQELNDDLFKHPTFMSLEEIDLQLLTRNLSEPADLHEVGLPAWAARCLVVSNGCEGPHCVRSERPEHVGVRGLNVWGVAGLSVIVGRMGLGVSVGTVGLDVWRGIVDRRWWTILPSELGQLKRWTSCLFRIIV